MSSKDVKVTLEILNPQSDAGEPSLRSFTLQPGEVMPIGRASKSSHKNLNPAENNVYINSPVISREHATLKRVQDNENLYIEDCGSLHGTELNETKLDKNRDYPLKSGDIIRLGQPVTHTTETFTAPRCRVEVEHLTKTPMLTPANPQHSHGYSVPETDSDDDSMADDEAPVPVPFTVADDEVPVAAPLTVADDEAPVPTSFTPADNDAPLLATVTPPEGRRKNPTYEEITKFHAAAFRATSAHREASIGATKDKGKRFVCDAEAHSKPEDVSSSESEDNSSDGSNEDEDSRGSSYDSNEEEDESSPVASRHDSDSSSEENSSVASGEGSEDGTPPRIRPRNHREPNDGTPRSRQHSYKEYDDGTPPHGRQYYYGEYDDGTSPCARQRSDRNYDDEYDENQEYYENQEYDNEYDEGQEYDPEQFRNRDSADIYRPYRSFRPRNYRENHREDSLEYDEDSNYNHRNCREYRGSASWLDYGRCNRKDPLDSRREDPNSYNDEGQTAGFRGHDDEGSQGYHGYDRDAYHGDPREGFRTPIPPYSTSSGAVVHVHHASMPIPQHMPIPNPVPPEMNIFPPYGTYNLPQVFYPPPPPPPPMVSGMVIPQFRQIDSAPTLPEAQRQRPGFQTASNLLPPLSNHNGPLALPGGDTGHTDNQNSSQQEESQLVAANDNGITSSETGCILTPETQCVGVVKPKTGISIPEIVDQCEPSSSSNGKKRKAEEISSDEPQAEQFVSANEHIANEEMPIMTLVDRASPTPNTLPCMAPKNSQDTKNVIPQMGPPTRRRRLGEYAAAAATGAILTFGTLMALPDAFFA